MKSNKPLWNVISFTSAFTPDCVESKTGETWGGARTGPSPSFRRYYRRAKGRRNLVGTINPDTLPTRIQGNLLIIRHLNNYNSYVLHVFILIERVLSFAVKKYYKMKYS